MIHIIGEQPKRSEERIFRNRQRWAKKIQKNNNIQIESLLIEGLIFQGDDYRAILEHGYGAAIMGMNEVPQVCAFGLMVKWGDKVLFVTECQGSIEETESEERYNFSPLAHATLNILTEKLSCNTMKLVQIHSLGMYDYPKLYDPLEKAEPFSLVAYVGNMQEELNGKIMPWFNIRGSLPFEKLLAVKQESCNCN